MAAPGALRSVHGAKGTTMNTRRKPKGRSLMLVLVWCIVGMSAVTLLYSVHSISAIHDQAMGSPILSGALEQFKNHQQQQRDLVQHALPIPNPTELASGQDSISACLLVMDDNHRLVEWLAYHYHVLPLRYLIVSVDPRSRTRPTHYLNKYRRLGMTVEEWNDFDFMQEKLARNPINETVRFEIKRDRHRMRQKVFYQHCLARMRDMNRTYTMLIDTDEFLTYNHRSGEGEYEQWEQQQTRKFDQWKKQEFEYHEDPSVFDRKRIPLSKAPPSIAQQGQLIHFIRREKDAGHPFFQSPCISIPRLQFGAIESTQEERQHSIPDGMDAMQFDTLRFRKHADRTNFVQNGLAKVMIDVSQVQQKVFFVPSVHRPMRKICKQPWNDEWESGLRINHYLGSWEAYSFRDDARRGGERSKEGWSFQAQDADDTDDNIRPWFGGFVDTHGKEEASELLKDAGLPKDYQNPNETAWTILFLDEIMGVNETKGNDNRKQFDNFVRQMHGKNTDGDENE